MKELFAGIILVVALAGSQAIAQEHKQEEQKGESQTTAQKRADAAKPDSKKCCEGMEKTDDIKEGAPTKSNMKAKMEKMKKMKGKMAEKMKGSESMKMKDMKSEAKTAEPAKDAHQH